MSTVSATRQQALCESPHSLPRADHMHRMAIMSFVLQEQGLDFSRCARTAQLALHTAEPALQPSCPEQALAADQAAACPGVSSSRSCTTWLRVSECSS